MEISSAARRSYDHRLKNSVACSRNSNLFPELAIPKRTTSRWASGVRLSVVTASEFSEDHCDLVAKLKDLEARCRGLTATLTLVRDACIIFGLPIDWSRLPEGEAKQKLIKAVDNCSTEIPLGLCLKEIGLSTSRYYRWRKLAFACQLSDVPSCPKLKPSKLTPKELSEMKELVTSPAFAHFSIRALSWLAKRTCSVFASATTWGRQIKAHKWLRPRIRLYPAKPKVGIRAIRPNQLWHIDVTIVRLVDGTKAYLQAVIDNYSRYVLDWKVSTDISAVNTRDLLLSALAKAKILGHVGKPEVFSDGGPENDNADVAGLGALGLFTLTLAQIDVTFSNSLIEALFRSVKHNYLFQQRLETLAIFEGHASFYLTQHNEVMPHNAFKGATPLEMYTGSWGPKCDAQLLEEAKASKAARHAHNTAGCCPICPF